MDAYSHILQKAVAEIVHVFRKKSNQTLTTDRRALLIPKTKQVIDMESFELVTWLVIK